MLNNGLGDIRYMIFIKKFYVVVSYAFKFLCSLYVTCTYNVQADKQYYDLQTLVTMKTKC